MLDKTINLIKIYIKLFSTAELIFMQLQLEMIVEARLKVPF